MKDLNKLAGKDIPSFLAVVNGKRDSGKSTFIRQYLIPKMQQHKPVIILDITGEYTGDYIHEGYEDFEKCIEDNAGVPVGVHVVKWQNMVADPVNLLSCLASLSKKLKKLPVTLVLDEGHMLFSKTLKNKIEQPLNQVCFMGAHYGLDTIICTQRPYNLSVNVRSQAAFFVSFKQKEQADLDYLRKKGEAPDNADEIIANLDNYEFFSIGERPEGLDEIKINEINKLKL